MSTHLSHFPFPLPLHLQGRPQPQMEEVLRLNDQKVTCWINVFFNGKAGCSHLTNWGPRVGQVVWNPNSKMAVELTVSVWRSSAISLEKAMATHSSTPTWKIPREEPGRLQSTGSLRVGHDWAASLSLFTFLHWRRKWQPTPVFLPGESQGRGSLVGCRLWGHTELDTTEVT